MNKNLNDFGKFKIIKLLDIYKYLEHFRDQNLKKRLELALEDKDNERLNESEEEELKQMY